MSVGTGVPRALAVPCQENFCSDPKVWEASENSKMDVRHPRRLLAFCAFITSALDVESKGIKNVFLVVPDVFSAPVWVSTRLEYLYNELTAKLLEKVKL